MAYNGYLIKIKGVSGSSAGSGDYTIPLGGYVSEKTYKGTYSVLDGDSKRNGSGVLVRTVLPHKVAHCSVDFMPLDNTKVDTMFAMIRARFTDERAHKLRASIWVPMLGDYVEDDFYLPDIEFTINQVTDSGIKYEPFTLELIGY